MKRLIPRRSGIFMDVSPHTDDSKALFGLSENQHYAFIGGGRRKNETLEEALEREIYGEAKATILPSNFGNPAFNLNIQLVHPVAYVCLLTRNNRYISTPEDFTGNPELKIVLRGQEMTGNAPVDCEELTELGYYDYPMDPMPKGRDMRELVKRTYTMRRKTWKSLKPGCQLNYDNLRHKMKTKLLLDPDYVDENFPDPPAIQHPRAMQQQLHKPV